MPSVLPWKDKPSEYFSAGDFVQSGLEMFAGGLAAKFPDLAVPDG
jgi:hypothetical protein